MSFIEYYKLFKQQISKTLLIYSAFLIGHMIKSYINNETFDFTLLFPDIFHKAFVKGFIVSLFFYPFIQKYFNKNKKRATQVEKLFSK